MTRKEEIKQLELLLDYCENMITSEAPVWARDCEALKAAISALRGPTREQVEKMKTRMQNVYDDDPLVDCGYCERCGAYVVDGAFCSKCGSPFTDEAVDLLTKRLEEVLNADTGSV